jgi:pimeloyl-ACP methyl ester carboxylesterase
MHDSGLLHLDSGLSASYQALGPTTGETLLFLHGFLGSKDCWRSLLPCLSRQYRCIALDLLGFGDSSKPAIRYDVATEVEFLRQFINQLALGPCWLVGHSFGSWVAAAYALCYPAAGLVLTGPAGIRDDSFCGKYDRYRPLLWPSPIIDAALWAASPIAKLTGRSTTWQKLRWFRQQIKRNRAARSFILDRLRPEDAIDTVEKDIHQLKIPTLIIAGAKDTTIPLWHSQTYAQEIPHARLIIIPEADHSLPQNYGPQVAKIIQQFLDDQSAYRLG